MGLSRTVSDIKGDICKNKIPTRLYLTTPAENFVTAVKLERTGMTPLPNSATICPLVLTQYRHWTDGQTDRQTDRQIELVTHYRALHVLRADARSGADLRGASPLASFNHAIDPYFVTFSTSL